MGRPARQKKTPGRIRNPRGNPIRGTICAVLMIVIFAYFAWIYWDPLHLLFGILPGTFPPPPILILDTIIFAPLMYRLIRLWLRTMMKRSSGPAAGIDTVEPGRAEPEPGDEWGRATRPYKTGEKSKIFGSKSEIREAPFTVDDGFYVKLPDLETGEELFDIDELRARAMIRSTVSSGGWVDKSQRTRAMGSLQASETQHGRHYRSRRRSGDAGSIDIPATVIAAVSRSGRFKAGRRVEIRAEDVREKVFTGHTPLTVILVIDVSLSMKGSMKQVRKILGRIEQETRGSKDRVGIIAFKDSGAVEVQAPTTNWMKLYRGLARLRISGLTPLAEGLMKSIESIKRERMRNPNIEPLVIVISDFAPNIPLAQTAAPGHARFTPVRDLVKAARMIRKAGVRLAAVNLDTEQIRWVRFLKRPYHDALELATLLRMRKDGRQTIVETILAVPEFRKTFGAYLIASVAGGRAFLGKEVMEFESVLGEFLKGSTKRVRIDPRTLKEAEAYIRG